MLRKRIVAPITASNIVSCRVRDAAVMADTNATDLTAMVTTMDTIRPAYTVAYVRVVQRPSDDDDDTSVTFRLPRTSSV